MKSFIDRSIQSVTGIRLVTLSVALLFISIPFDTFEPIAGVSFLRIMAVPVIIFGLLQSRYATITRQSPLLYLLMFIGLILAVLPFSVAITATAVRCMTFAMYALLIFVASGVKYTDHEKTFLKKAFITSSWVSVVLLLFFYYNYEGRMTIAFHSDFREDPNHFSGYLLPGLVYYFYQLYTNRKFTLVTIASFMLFASVLFLSGSRGGLLAGAVGIITVIGLQIKNVLGAIKHSVVMGLLLLSAVGFITQVLPQYNPEMAARFSVESVVSSGGTGRIDIWNSYITLLSQSPPERILFGYGAGTLPHIHGVVAHNNWIEVLLEAGVVGLALYTIMIWTALRSLYRSREYGLFALFMSYIALTVSLSLFSYKPIWAMMILVIVLMSQQYGTAQKTAVRHSV